MAPERVEGLAVEQVRCSSSKHYSFSDCSGLRFKADKSNRLELRNVPRVASHLQPTSLCQAQGATPARQLLSRYLDSPRPGLFGIAWPDRLLSRFPTIITDPRFPKDHFVICEVRDSLMTSTRNSLEYLVVGTGRSGTLYAAKLLTALGKPCGHERIFTGGEPTVTLPTIEQGGENSACGKHFGLEFDGPPVAESSYMAVPFMEHECLKNSTIIHVVRDPLNVIRSFLNNLLFFREDRASFRHAPEQFLYEHLPHLDFLPDPVSRACFYYLRWNQMIEESIGDRKYLLYPIENGPDTLLKFMGLDSGEHALPDNSCNAYSKWPDHMRISTDLPTVADEEIRACFLWKDVATLARKYGYNHATKGLNRIDRTQLAGLLNRVPAVHSSRSEKPVCYPMQPRMVQENFHGFNLIQFKDAFFGVHQDVGSLDLTCMSPVQQENLRKNGKLFRESSLSELRVLIHLLDSERKQESISAEILKAQSQGRQSLDSIRWIEAELRNMNEALHRTEASVVRLRPWYRKLAGKLRQLWQARSSQGQPSLSATVELR
jgi:hypothetical protein